MNPIDDISSRLAEVHQRIERAGGDPEAITVLAVTKGFGMDVARQAAAAGLTELGENYGQELEAKAAAWPDDPASPPVRWHFIGRLQRNKVRKLVPYVSLWQSVDRPEVAEEIARRQTGAAVLVQLDPSGEPNKGGCPPAEVPALVERCRSLQLDIRGLMAIAPAGPPERARPGFRALVKMADDLGLPERSIGMSGDLEVAVEEGSTMVRVGTALFGPRVRRRDVRT